jgi:hypothetical protein
MSTPTVMSAMETALARILAAALVAEIRREASENGRRPAA